MTKKLTRRKAKREREGPMRTRYSESFEGKEPIRDGYTGSFNVPKCNLCVAVHEEGWEDEGVGEEEE